MDEAAETVEKRSLTLEEVLQPWEQVGASRRDCVPHRAPLLVLLARVSLLAGGLAFPCPPLGLVGLGLGLVTGALARHDLDLIRAGDMDQRGYQRTEKARADSHAGVVLSLLAGLLWFLLVAPVLVLLCLM